MGFLYFDQLASKGWEEACRLYVQYYPERLNANAFIGIITALEDTVWTRATSEQKARAHQLVNELRKDLGLPPAKKLTKKLKRR
jgi:hypothetical protein